MDTHYIYGLFDKHDVCHYIGRTRSPKGRKNSHSRRFTDCIFTILVACEAISVRYYEFMFIRYFENLGQCQANKMGTKGYKPIRHPDQTAKAVVTRQDFYNRVRRTAKRKGAAKP